MSDRTKRIAGVPELHQQAAVLPLELSTGATALFQKDHLGLQHPTAALKRTGQTVLIGAELCVGSNAIRLAVAGGYEVVTTSSPNNADYGETPGASHTFDRKQTEEQGCDR